jgi:Glycosyl hydrolase 108/Predicted Peptidoglycan domain
VIPVDEFFGSQTADAANSCDPQQLLSAICTRAIEHYKIVEAKNPQMSSWFRGWDGRAAWVPPVVDPPIVPSNFAKAIEVVITVHEGGFQNLRSDPGNFTPSGELKGTKYGISAHSFPNTDIENLTLTGAEDLYRQVWGRFSLLVDQRVLTKVLDLAVNMQWAGHGPATGILQQAVDDLQPNQN